MPSECSEIRPRWMLLRRNGREQDQVTSFLKMSMETARSIQMTASGWKTIPSRDSREVSRSICVMEDLISTFCSRQQLVLVLIYAPNPETLVTSYQISLM